MMYTYEEFKEKVVSELRSFLPKEYEDAELKVFSVAKVNRQMDGLTLCRKGSNVSPTLYINCMYEEYLQSGDYERVMTNIAKAYVNAVEAIPQIGVPDITTDAARNNIVFQLVNTRQNEGLLVGVPHREFLDLSIIYKWIIKVDSNGIQATIISNGLAEKLGLTEEQLFELSSENTPRLMPTCVESITDVIRNMMPEGFDEEGVDLDLQGPSMWVVSNSHKYYGASAMLDSEALYELSVKEGCNLIVLPSSVHEVIAVPETDGAGDVEFLLGMVTGINDTEVSMEERLSNSVYYYDREKRSLSIAASSGRGLSEAGC